MAFLTGETGYLDKVETMYSTFYNDVTQQASAATYFIQSLLLTENKTKEVVIIGARDDPQRIKLIDSLQSEFLPDTVILIGESAKDYKNITSLEAKYNHLEQ